MSYCVTTAMGIKIGAFHNIVIGIGVGFICFAIGNLFGKPLDNDTMEIFFPEKM